MVDEGDEGARRENGGRAGPRRLGSAGFGTDEPEPHGAGGHRRRQRAGHRRDLSIEVQLPDSRPAVQGVLRDDAHDRHEGEGNGQVVVVALLGEVRRGEVGDYAPGRQGETQSGEGGPHPLARLAHRLVGEADDNESGKATDRLDLDASTRRASTPSNATDTTRAAIGPIPPRPP